MDPSVQSLLSDIGSLSDGLIDGNGSVNSQKRRELLNTSQKLCIALQSHGQLVEEFLFGVSHNNST